MPCKVAIMGLLSNKLFRSLISVNLRWTKGRHIIEQQFKH